MDGRESVVAEFEDEDAAGFEMRGGMGDEVGVEFVAFFATVERDFRFVIADFAHERFGFAAADVGRVADDEVKEERRRARDHWRIKKRWPVSIFHKPVQ